MIIIRCQHHLPLRAPIVGWPIQGMHCAFVGLLKQGAGKGVEDKPSSNSGGPTNSLFRNCQAKRVAALQTHALPGERRRCTLSSSEEPASRGSFQHLQYTKGSTSCYIDSRWSGSLQEGADRRTAIHLVYEYYPLRTPGTCPAKKLQHKGSWSRDAEARKMTAQATRVWEVPWARVLTLLLLLCAGAVLAQGSAIACSLGRVCLPGMFASALSLLSLEKVLHDIEAEQP